MVREYSLRRLNTLANSFEAMTTCRNSTRLWALLVLANIQENPYSYSLVRIITQWMGQSSHPTSDKLEKDWINWLNINKTVLNHFLHFRWDVGSALNVGSAFFDGNEFILSSSSNEPTTPDYIKSSHLLKGIGDIPNLWIHVGNYQRGIRPIPPDLAHNNWLMKMLEFNGYNVDQFNILREFIDKNKETIKKIRSSFSISEPRYLGSGADGVAFDIGEGKILKIFGSAYSFNAAKLALDRLHKNPDLAKTEAMIYDIGELEGFQVYKSKLYYYIIEKMTPVRSIKGLADNIDIILMQIIQYIGRLKNDERSRWSALKSMVNDPTRSSKIKKEIKEDVENIYAKLEKYEQVWRPEIAQLLNIQDILHPDWLKSFIEEVIMKYLTERTDLHMGNLGVTGYGKLRYFDPAYGEEGSHFSKRQTNF